MVAESAPRVGMWAPGDNLRNRRRLWRRPTDPRNFDIQILQIIMSGATDSAEASLSRVGARDRPRRRGPAETWRHYQQAMSPTDPELARAEKTKRRGFQAEADQDSPRIRL